MNDERGLARRPQAEISPLKQNSLGIEPPGPESIRRILQDGTIPWLDRRRLVKDEIRMMVITHKEHTQKSLEVERVKMVLAKDVRIRNLEGQYTVHHLELESKFISLFQSLGITVTQQLYSFMKEYGELITQYKREIDNNEKIDETFKERILARLNKSFHSFLDKIEYITDDLLAKVEHEQRHPKNL